MPSTYRNPFRSAPVFAVGDRGFTVSVISEAGQFHHERWAATWGQALRTALWFEFEFPSRVVVMSDFKHVWLLREIIEGNLCNQ